MTLFSLCAWGAFLCLVIALPAYAADLLLEHSGAAPYPARWENKAAPDLAWNMHCGLGYRNLRHAAGLLPDSGAVPVRVPANGEGFDVLRR
jgi:hypothetical protein